MRKTGMHARVLRIGQLSGDKTNAIWNDTEAVALMLRSALTVGALPALDEQPSWLPVDSCAQAVANVSTASSTSRSTAEHDADLVYHLVNPCTFNWKHDLLPALQKRSRLSSAFDVVDTQEWLRRLGKSEQDPEKNPSIKLIDFWRSKYSQTKTTHTEVDDQPAGLTFETVKTVEDCPSLAEEQDPVSAGLVERYVDVWFESWLSN